MFRREPTEVLLLASTLLVGCGTLFGIDDPERPPPSGAASGGGGTRGGTSGGGAGGTVDPPGGSGMAGDGGEVSTGGSIATGGSDAGGGTAGSAGRGGGGSGGDGDEFPSMGDPCPTPGALACLGPAQNRRLMCEGGVWTEAEACDDDGNNQRNCDRRSGVCARVVDECWNEQPDFQYEYCPEGGIEASTCGPDLVTIALEHCELGCNNDTQKCAEASADELVFDHVPRTRADFVFWPTPVIPVCFRHEDDEFGTERAVIRDEVDSTWGRYSRVAFSGWNECSSPPPELAEVRIALVDDCVGELARIPRYGYPGPGAKLELAICKSYVDGHGAEQVADEAMLRFVARHLFGHVLGREHVPWDFMRPVFEPSIIPELVFDEPNIEAIQQTYGGKPSGSLVNARGQCVGSSPGGFIGMHVCDGSAETRWQALDGRLEADGRTGCLHASVGGPTNLLPCATTPEFVWETDEVQWRGNAGRCVTKSMATGGPSLVLETCRAFRDANQTWSFDFYPGRRVRIRAANGDCVHVPEAVGRPPSSPELGPCEGTRYELDMTTSAQLGLSGYCMTERVASGYEVRLAPCQVTPTQSFYLSGPLAHYADTALTVASESELYADPMNGAPTQAQIFDYYF